MTDVLIRSVLILANISPSHSDSIRTSDVLGSEPFAKMIKVDELWMEDGNIVLATQSFDIFKVYRGILDRHTRIFRDKHAIPCPKDVIDEEIYEGVPIVRLTDDWMDVTHLLHVLLDRKYFASFYEPPLKS